MSDQVSLLAYDVKDLPDVLRTSAQTIEMWIREYGLPVVQPGGHGTKRIVPRRALEDWLTQNASTAHGEVA